MYVIKQKKQSNCVQINIILGFAAPCCAYIIQDCSLYANNLQKQKYCCSEHTVHKANSTYTIMFLLYNSSVNKKSI